MNRPHLQSVFPEAHIPLCLQRKVNHFHRRTGECPHAKHWRTKPVSAILVVMLHVLLILLFWSQTQATLSGLTMFDLFGKHNVDHSFLGIISSTPLKESKGNHIWEETIQTMSLLKNFNKWSFVKSTFFHDTLWPTPLIIILKIRMPCMTNRAIIKQRAAHGDCSNTVTKLCVLSWVSIDS